jgi:hypothetical protein
VSAYPPHPRRTPTGRHCGAHLAARPSCSFLLPWAAAQATASPVVGAHAWPGIRQRALAQQRESDAASTALPPTPRGPAAAVSCGAPRCSRSFRAPPWRAARRARRRAAGARVGGCSRARRDGTWPSPIQAPCCPASALVRRSLGVPPPPAPRQVAAQPSPLSSGTPRRRRRRRAGDSGLAACGLPLRHGCCRSSPLAAQQDSTRSWAQPGTQRTGAPSSREAASLAAAQPLAESRSAPPAGASRPGAPPTLGSAL